MTDDLSTKLAVLTEDRPEPADPAAPIRQRIESRRRRRRGTAAIVAVAAATAAVLAAGPILGSLHQAGSEPGVAGFGATIPSARVSPYSPMVSPTGDHKTVLPAPWSDEVFTKEPDANAYLPKAYYVAKGSIPAGSWAMLAFSEFGCMVSDESPAVSFGRPWVCFNNWTPGQKVNYHVVQGHAKEKSATKIAATLIFGAVSADARRVKLQVPGRSYDLPAVATPATNRMRFFAVVVPDKDVTDIKLTPVDAKGNVVGAPTGVPAGMACTPQCATATPAK
ncbi:hypothetical protein ACWCOV_06545 [Kribbella sp. NPDC002412]